MDESSLALSVESVSGRQEFLLTLTRSVNGCAVRTKPAASRLEVNGLVAASGASIQIYLLFRTQSGRGLLYARNASKFGHTNVTLRPSLARYEATLQENVVRGCLPWGRCRLTLVPISHLRRPRPKLSWNANLDLSGGPRRVDL